MRMTVRIDEFVSEMYAEGRFSSERTERSYRNTLRLHAEDVGNRDPKLVGRDDVKHTLQRWGNPNTRSLARSHLVSFYDWLMESGVRKDNPARQTRRPKTRKSDVYRLTREEVRACRAAALGVREQRIVDFGFLAGLRAQELTGLQGRHLRRAGAVWVSPDIAKNHKQRWVPVLPELEATFLEAAASVGDSEYVLPNKQESIHGGQRKDVYDPSEPMSYGALRDTMRRIGERAGIKARVKPHLMRHAYGDHLAKFAGIKIAQYLLGHVSVSTTERYTGQPSLEEVATAIAGFGYGSELLSPADSPLSAAVAPARSIGLLTAGCDPERVSVPSEGRTWALGDFPQILMWLRANPVLRRVAREMGTYA